MDFGPLLLSLALILLTVVFIARPLLERASKLNSAPAPADDLIAQREAVLIELRDLDFDHATGKMSDEDYAAQRTRQVAKGAEVLRALAAQKPETPLDTGDADIERMVSARRGQTPVAREANIEQAIAARRAKPNGKPVAPLACPQCAKPIQAGDKFCAKCGAKLMLTGEAA